MAMMVVTTAITLLLVGMSALAVNDHSGLSKYQMERAASQIKDGIFRNPDLCPLGDYLDRSCLYKIERMEFDVGEGIRGFKIVLAVLGDEPEEVVLLLQGEIPLSLDCYATLRSPVNLLDPPSEIRAAILVIMVW